MKNNIEFSTGNLTLEEDSLSFNKKNVRSINVSTILRENIVHVIKEPIKILPKAEKTHCIQLATFGFIFSIIGFIIGITTSIYIMFYLGIVLTFLSGFLLLSNLWLDSTLWLNIAKPILYGLFGVDYFKVVVQNIYGGNNLMFLIRKDEIPRLPNIENYKINKKHNVQSVVRRPRLRANVFL